MKLDEEAINALDLIDIANNLSTMGFWEGLSNGFDEGIEAAKRLVEHLAATRFLAGESDAEEYRKIARKIAEIKKPAPYNTVWMGEAAHNKKLLWKRIEALTEGGDDELD